MPAKKKPPKVEEVAGKLVASDETQDQIDTLLGQANNLAQLTVALKAIFRLIR